MGVLYGCLQHKSSEFGVSCMMWYEKQRLRSIMLDDLVCGVSEESLERLSALANNTERIL